MPTMPGQFAELEAAGFWTSVWPIKPTTLGENVQNCAPNMSTIHNAIVKLTYDLRDATKTFDERLT